MNNSSISFLVKRELNSYFATPIGYVFILVYAILSFAFTFFAGNFFELNDASLNIFFVYQPWLFLLLVPAAGMRLWAEERQTGTIELLMTMPLSLWETVIAKFLAGWIFIAAALAVTFPFLVTVGVLGSPDYGPIFTGYLGCLLLAGCYLSVSCLASVLSKNQVISFILSFLFNFLILIIGWGLFTDVLFKVLPTGLADFIVYASYSTRFESIRRGVLDTRDLIYFLTVIGFFLTLNHILLKNLKSK